MVSTVAKNLLIVESPAKTRTLKKFLGSQYAVEASVGHIRDLIKKDMGIGPSYEPRYEVLPAKKEVVKKLRAAAKKADTVYLAPDPDREGEAIAWHISEVLGKEPGAVRRVTFNEITRRAVLQALENPGTIDYRKVDAQQARRVLDRLMGFRLSPLLWEKVKQGLSAGRVQSVALKMVCDRQAEIDAFKSQEYWNLGADVAAAEPPPFSVRLLRIDGKKAEVATGEQAAAIVRDLDGSSFVVRAVERKESQQKPNAPFITSRLQQEAAKRLGFSVKRTMALAQGLYEGSEIGDRGAIGLITYMRTDSTRVADEAVAGARDFIAATFGAAALPAKPNVYSSRKGAQDAHEAIRPTTFDLPPDQVKDYLKDDEWKLYKLIWERFMASQMQPALFDVTQVDVESGPEAREGRPAGDGRAAFPGGQDRAPEYLLRATGRTLKQPGFLAIYREVPESGSESPDSGENGERAENGGDSASAGEQSESTLPPLSPGERLRLIKVTSEQKFTQPKAQYSEATLVKALEENGIGRPSTYASILSTLTDRDYVDKSEGRFRPTALGTLVNGMLQKGFHDILNEGYTAALELQLDQIEDGTLGWKDAVKDFDQKFSQDLALAGEQMPNVKRDGVPLDESCPECGGQLLMRFGRYGTFVGCSNYPQCKFTRDLQPAPASSSVAATAGNGGAGKGAAGATGAAGTPAGAVATAGAPSDEEIPLCEECGRPMALRRSRFGTFYGCTGYPECKGIRKVGPKAEPPRPTGVACPECGQGWIEEKRSRRGKIFYSCNRYPDCKFALWNKPVAKPCPDCNAPFLLEKTTKKAGTRLVCNTEGCEHSEGVEPAA
ncbi:MAG TPA: type I DNA topoisomerase [Thermoanaerobaculia bacterium]|nr:type I DNA topoisomerase [Thermoanaerobaculia bacterium]